MLRWMGRPMRVMDYLSLPSTIQTMSDLLAGDIDLGKLLKKLTLEDTTIVPDSLEQPSLFLEAGRLRVQKMRARVSAEMELKLAKAQVYLDARKGAEAAGTKATETTLDNQVLVNPKVRKLATRFTVAQEEEEFADLLVQAYRMRRDALRILADMAQVELSLAQGQARRASQTAGLEEAKEKLRGKYRDS